jgi:hypothetical protein
LDSSGFPPLPCTPDCFPGPPRALQSPSARFIPLQAFPASRVGRSRAPLRCGPFGTAFGPLPLPNASDKGRLDVLPAARSTEHPSCRPSDSALWWRVAPLLPLSVPAHFCPQISKGGRNGRFALSGSGFAAMVLIPFRPRWGDGEKRKEGLRGILGDSPHVVASKPYSEAVSETLPKRRSPGDSAPLRTAYGGQRPSPALPVCEFATQPYKKVESLNSGFL